LALVVVVVVEVWCLSLVLLPCSWPAAGVVPLFLVRRRKLLQCGVWGCVDGDKRTHAREQSARGNESGVRGGGEQALGVGVDPGQQVWMMGGRPENKVCRRKREEERESSERARLIRPSSGPLSPSSQRREQPSSMQQPTGE
jgi:hypothetical protein